MWKLRMHRFGGLAARRNSGYRAERRAVDGWQATPVTFTSPEMRTAWLILLGEVAAKAVYVQPDPLSYLRQGTLLTARADFLCETREDRCAYVLLERKASQASNALAWGTLSEACRAHGTVARLMTLEDLMAGGFAARNMERARTLETVHDNFDSRGLENWIGERLADFPCWTVGELAADIDFVSFRLTRSHLDVALYRARRAMRLCFDITKELYGNETLIRRV